MNDKPIGGGNPTFGANRGGGAGGGGAFPGFGSNVLGPTALGTSGVGATAQRSDQVPAAYRSDLPLSSTWFIDPVNGSDNRGNAGTTSATALKTLAELNRRWWGAQITSNTVVTILGDIPSSDTNAWNFKLKPGVLLHFIGTLGATTGFGGIAIDNTLYTGSVTGFVAGSDGPAAQDIELTDTAIPVSYTASGLLASGVLFKRTNSTARYWWALKDLGSKTLRISCPVTSDTAVANDMSQALSVADTYSAYAVWTFPRQAWGVGIGNSDASVPNRGPGQVQVTRCREIGENQGAGPDPQSQVRRNAVWVDFPTIGNSFIIDNPVNCCWNVGASQAIFHFTSVVPPQVLAICARGTGAGQIKCFGTGGFNGPCVFQGVRLSFDMGRFEIIAPMAFHDVTSNACLEVLQKADVVMAPLLPAGAGVSGVGNTVKLLAVNASVSGGTFLLGSSAMALPPFASACTTDTTPIQIGAGTYTPAGIPAAYNTCLGISDPFPAAALLSYSEIVDMTVAGVSTIIPPTVGRLFRGAQNFELKTVGGTRSVSPTYSIGTNAPNYDNVYASQVGPAGLLSQGAETTVGWGTAVGGFAVPDLSTSGLKINITSPMTGVAPVCTARLFTLWTKLPV